MNIRPEITSLIDKIKSDRTHGASQLARQAVEKVEATKYSQSQRGMTGRVEQGN